MRYRRALALVLGSSVLVPIASTAVAAAQEPGGPTLVADRYDVSEGMFVRVSGTGWSAAGTGLVSVQVCGNGAVDASADCNLAGTAAGGVREGGTFYAGITVHRPPKPCPCVLRAYGAGGAQQVTVPIAIEGMPTAIPTPALGVNRSVAVTEVSIESGDPWTTLLGAPPSRQVVFSVTNTGDVLLHDPPVSLAWGRGESPDGLMRAPALGDLVPGQTVVSRVDVPMGVLSFGDYRVTIRVAPLGGDPVTASAETSTYPWLLLGAGLVLLQLVLLRLRNGYRRRHGAPPGPPSASDDSSDGAIPGAEQVPDPVLAAAGVRRTRPTFGAVFGAALLLGALAGCGDSSDPDASSEDLSSDPDCALTAEQAADLLPGEPTVTELPPAGSDALLQPSSRCRYEGGGWNVQLSVYPGLEPFERLQSFVADPELGSSVAADAALCGTDQAATDAVVSCLLMAGGDTMALVLRVPNGDVDETLEPRIRDLAAVLASDL